MGTLAIGKIVESKEDLESSLDQSLIHELASIIEEAEKPAKKTVNEVSPWYYFVPCAGVRYYSYQESPSPVER